MDNKLTKSLERFKERIANGSYYEAQQTIRSITNRYIFKKQFDLAISLLYQSSIILINNKQFDESADLYLYLIEVFEKENKEWNEFDRNDLIKLINLINMLPNNDINLINLSRETNKFLINKSGKIIGDEKVNYLFGSKMIKSGDKNMINNGEKLLILNNNENSIKLLIEFEWGCYLQNGEFNKYLERIVIPYLMIKNIKFAKIAMNEMINKYVERNGDKIKYEEIEGLKIINGGDDDNNGEVINFIQLLVKILERFNKEDSNSFTTLLKRYNNMLNREGIFEKINEIAISYYDISFIKKQSNLLQDMMGSFLK